MKLYKSKEWLYRRYVVQKKTVTEIAEECKTSYQTVYRYLVSFNLIRDPRKIKR